MKISIILEIMVNYSWKCADIDHIHHHTQSNIPTHKSTCIMNGELANKTINFPDKMVNVSHGKTCNDEFTWYKSSYRKY